MRLIDAWPGARSLADGKACAMPSFVTESVGPPTAQLEPRQARKGATVEKSGCGGPSQFRVTRRALPSVPRGILSAAAARPMCASTSGPEHLDVRAVVCEWRVEGVVHQCFRDGLRAHARR